MNNNSVAAITIGGNRIFIPIIAILICTHAIFAQDPSIKFKIKDTPDSIVVATKIYSLALDKKNGVAYLKNWQGIPYTAFPLDVQYNLAEERDLNRITRQWTVKDKIITATAAVDGLAVQEIKIICLEDAFEIKIGSLPNYDPSTIGAYLLRRNDGGFDTANWEQYFSPEPDDYFRSNPAIDLRADRDQQWIFAPAPLNLSFKTKAGWFSIGLAELPDASVFNFKNKALWLDFPWDKIQPQPNQLYRFPSLVFTFNRSPWEAVGDFSRYLSSKKNPSAKKEIQRLDWWRRPLVSTWGEQRVQQMTGDHPNFNGTWVKNYIAQQQQALDNLKFNVMIENKWSGADGDPSPADRFQDLRELIDWCHEQDMKVILFWKAWKVEANSLPIRMGSFEGEYVDATHPLFESYVDSCCQVIFGSGASQLNADGLKIDQLYLMRDPAKAKYARSSQGIGFREAYRYLEVFYRTAKKYKPDALVVSSAIDPHFAEVQDMVRINDDWDNKTVREKRARIITQSLPGMLIDGDAADMSATIIGYHYITSAVYGVPCIQYLSRLASGEINPATRLMLVQLLRLYQQAPANGQLNFVDYGQWQIRSKNNELLMQSLPGGRGILQFQDRERATLLCSEGNQLLVAVEGLRLRSVADAGGSAILFKDLGQGIYEMNNLQPGASYQLRFKKEFLKSR